MSEDRSIAEAVSRIKIDFPNMEVGLSLEIGRAILAERERCANAAATVFNESDTPYESASAGRVYKLITGREIDEDQT